MPAPRKPIDERQNRRPQRDRSLAIVQPDAPSPVPACPVGLLKSSRELWRAFWQEPQAAGCTPVDRNVLERWVVARDQWRRAMNAVEKAPLVKGSTGQPVQNPLMSWVASREAAMEKIEKQFGIGMRNRSDLGISIGQAELTAHELNRMTQERDDQDGDAEEVEFLEEFERAE